MRPRAMLRTGSGLTGEFGTEGDCTTVTLTGLASAVVGVSSSATVSGNTSAIAAAMDWAVSGLGSRTETSMRTVSGGAAALTYALAECEEAPFLRHTGEQVRAAFAEEGIADALEGADCRLPD